MFAKSLSLGKDDIERAFQRHEFDIVLQPQIDVASGQTVAAEAFVRWQHPEFGAMTPQLFLPLVEMHGESPRLLDAVVRRGLRAAAALRHVGHDWRISINLGASDLQNGIAADVVTAALRASGLPADCLVLEAPEAAMADGNGRVIYALEQLRALGCGVALDSGGALPIEAAEHAPELFTEVKMGGAAIIRFAEIARKLDGGRIAKRLKFAHGRGVPAVAVGVENQQTLNALVKLGFNAVQGALIAKPQSLDALLAWDGTWSGEGFVPPARPEIRMRARPQLVVVPNTPPPSAPKLVESLTPGAAAFDFADMGDDDAMDVDFDDEAFGAPPPNAAIEPEAELDPSQDVGLDSEEMHAMETAAPLHAGMIERPKLRRPMAVPLMIVEPEPEPPAPPEIVFDRPLALRIKAPPARKGLLAKLGLGNLLRR